MRIIWFGSAGWVLLSWLLVVLHPLLLMMLLNVLINNIISSGGRSTTSSTDCHSAEVVWPKHAGPDEIKPLLQPQLHPKTP